MEFKDYYATLGIGRNAPADEVKAAFRKLARRYHPDVNPNDPSAERRFKEVNEAYEVLGNPETRRKYDQLGADWKLYEQAQPGGGHPFAGSWPFAGGRPGAAGRVRTVSGDDLRDMLGGDAFSDFFQTFFGGADPVSAGPGRRAQAASRRGRNLEQAIELTLEQAFTGVTRRLVLAGAGVAGGSTSASRQGSTTAPGCGWQAAASRAPAARRRAICCCAWSSCRIPVTPARAGICTFRCRFRSPRPCWEVRCRCPPSMAGRCA